MSRLLLLLSLVAASVYGGAVQNQQISEEASTDDMISATLPLCPEYMCGCYAPNEYPGDISFRANGTSGCLCECGRVS